MEQEPNHSLTESTHIYQKKEEKGRELRSTGYTFSFVALAGIIIAILSLTGILPFGFYGSTRYFSYSIMMLLFGIFLFIGIHSIIKSKKILEESIAENQLTAEILEWFLQNHSAASIDGLLPASIEDELYFLRIEAIAGRIQNHYQNLADDYSGFLSEQLYEALYEEKEDH